MSGLVTRLWILLVSCLPLKTAHAMAERRGRRRFRRGRPGSERLVSTLRARLDVPESEADRVARIVSERAGIEELDGGVFRFKSRARIADSVEFVGVEALDEALADGKGCVLYSGHFRGRWSVIAALGLRGYRPLLVRQPAPAMGRLALFFQKRFDAVFSSRFACDFLWMATPTPFSGALATSHLRENRVLVNLIDISQYTERVVDTPFLGRDEPFPVGPVLLSHLTGAPLVGFVIEYDQTSRRWVCRFDKPIRPSGPMEASTARLAESLDDAIRRRPEDWAGWEKRQYLQPLGDDA